MSERDEWMQLIRNEYDPAPSHYKIGDDWDDGAGRIADAILAARGARAREVQSMSEPVSDKYRAEMNATAAALDRLFNGNAKGKNRKVAFMLLVAEFDKMDGGRVNYIANGARADCHVMLKELLARWEGQPDQRGTA